MADRPERSDRLEREIEEILGKIDKFPSPESRQARARKRALRRFGAAISDRMRGITAELARVSISQVMLISFLLILASFFFRRFNPMLMQWALYMGIILFISSFAILVFSRRGGGNSGSQAQWRGRTIHYGRPTFFDRLRAFLQSGRARR